MATIQEVILNNDWRASTFRKSTFVNRLFNSGIVVDAPHQAQMMVDSIVMDNNVQSTITVGMVDYPFSEQNLGDASDTTVNSLKAKFDSANVKVFYGNQWWGAHKIQRDLMNMTEPNRLVLEHVGRFWATQWNKLIAATLSGLSSVPEITVGAAGSNGLGTANFSAQMVVDARAQRGDMGFGELARMYMHSSTLVDILTKQNSGKIPELISAVYGSRTVDKDGVETQVTGQMPSYVYGGVTPIVLDDELKAGFISLVENGAFAFTQKNLANPLAYLDNPKGGNGAGSEEWGCKSVYAIHPAGFSFKGVHSSTTGAGKFKSLSGLTIAELAAGGQYELSDDQKFAKVANLRVKMG
jgi:hypothetical protein